MTGSDDPPTGSSLSPDEAFSVLGNETRIGILRALGAADRPLSFTELRDCVGIRQGAQFNYHLDKLVGHFVEKGEDGYALRQAGRRVVEAVLSGAVTESPVVERTVVPEWPCPYCDAPTAVRYHEERVERYCTECAGLYGAAADATGRRVPGEHGDLGYLYLPPAGVEGRSAAEVLEAAFTWAYAEWLVAANGVCPRCSAPVEHSLVACEDHDPSETICGRCGQRQAVSFRTRCTNCTHELGSVVSMHLVATPELLTFLTSRGLDLLAEQWTWGWEYEEEVLSTDPFEARFTFTVDGDTIALTVDENLTVTDVTERRAPDTV